MARTSRWTYPAVLALSLGIAGASPAADTREERVDGYAEWHEDGCVVADGQKVCPARGFKFRGEGDARDLRSVPLGYELKAKGTRQKDGSILATEVEAKPNNPALFEKEIKSATDDMEQRARRAGRFQEQGSGGKAVSVGRLFEDGPRVDRVRRIVDDLLPPYLRPEDVRVYVIENKEWNAFAMGNYSIYVFSGLLDAMDDDEVAIVLGHELVHATHEHSRRQFKREMWVQVAALGALAATSTIDDDTKRTIVSLATGLAATAYSSGYGRGMEDQADRVGLRYAYEAGYDIGRGPQLWNRFAKKYGDGNKVANFFFSDHSQSAARAAKLRREIAYNYPAGAKADGARNARSTAPSETAQAAPAARAAASTATRALAATQPSPAAPLATRAEIRPGMTEDEVRAVLGPPLEEAVSGEETRWTYQDMMVEFVKGRVVKVRF